MSEADIYTEILGGLEQDGDFFSTRSPTCSRAFARDSPRP